VRFPIKKFGAMLFLLHNSDWKVFVITEKLERGGSQRIDHILRRPDAELHRAAH
jgi:hypothetical protein